MKKFKQETSQSIEPILGTEENQEPFEIIYADPRDEEIHLRILKNAQLNAHMSRWFLDPEYNQLLWSDGVFDLLEVDSRKYGANYFTFLDVVHPDDRELRDSIQKELPKIKKPIEVNYRLKMKDGRIKWINEICNTDYDKLGNPIRFYGVIQDITRYKLTEDQFRHREEQYKVLIDSIPAGIAIFQNNKITFINPAGVQIFGATTADELLGKSVIQFIHPDSKNDFRKKMNLIAKGELLDTFEEKCIRLDGSVFDAEITTIQAVYKGSTAFQLIVNDITQRKKADQILHENQLKLNELIATKDKFFSIIAHDLRSPFNSILGFLDLLFVQYDAFDDTERKEYIRLIAENTGTTLNLLENLLVWANSQRGRIEYQPVRQKLTTLLESVTSTFKSGLNLKGITLNVLVPDDLEIFADTNMLNTVLQNLISNAIKYSHQGGIISVNVEHLNNSVKVIVSDSGTGMTESTQKKLFSLEKEVSIPGTANEKGSGLGLILCKDFIEKHHGTIEVKSELGKGSQFIFTIPDTK
ncbi:MAG: PAS domain S-box protein [Bacteroidota bacterium]|nr:PAS domain S-box protein [Bacteroidota bacterium]